LRDRLAGLRRKIMFRFGYYHANPHEVPGIDLVPHNRLRKVVSGLIKASRSYWPELPFDGQIVLVCSSLPLDWVGVDMSDPLRGWSRWTTKPVKLYELPAPHTQVFRDEFLDELIPKIREILGDAKAELSGAKG
jgi:hypothetical protein